MPRKQFAGYQPPAPSLPRVASHHREWVAACKDEGKTLSNFGYAAVLTESGAFKALTLDFCETVGRSLPALSQQTADALRQVLPDFIPPTNPLDITAQALVDPDLYRRTLPVLLDDERYGSLVLSIILTDESTGQLKFPPILDALRNTRSGKPIIFAALDEGAPAAPSYLEQLRELSIPFFPSPERAFRALAREVLRSRVPRKPPGVRR